MEGQVEEQVEEVIEGTPWRGPRGGDPVEEQVEEVMEVAGCARRSLSSAACHHIAAPSPRPCHRIAITHHITAGQR